MTDVIAGPLPFALLREEIEGLQNDAQPYRPKCTVCDDQHYIRHTDGWHRCQQCTALPNRRRIKREALLGERWPA